MNTMSEKRFMDDPFYIFAPYRADASSYMLQKLPKNGPDDSSKPVPPKNRWMSEKHGDTAEEYLASGKRDIDEMRKILRQAGNSLESLGNILEIGCGDGRMIRWLEDAAPQAGNLGHGH